MKQVLVAAFDALGVCVGVISGGGSLRVENEDGTPATGYRYAVLTAEGPDELKAEEIRTRFEMTAGDAPRWKTGAGPRYAGRTLVVARLDRVD